MHVQGTKALKFGICTTCVVQLLTTVWSPMSAHWMALLHFLPLRASWCLISSWIPYEGVSSPSLGEVGGGEWSEENLKPQFCSLWPDCQLQVQNVPDASLCTINPDQGWTFSPRRFHLQPCRAAEGESGVHLLALWDCTVMSLAPALGSRPFGVSLWIILRTLEDSPTVSSSSDLPPSLQILFLSFAIPFSASLNPLSLKVSALTTGIPCINTLSPLPSPLNSKQLSHMCFWCLVGKWGTQISGSWLCVVEQWWSGRGEGETNLLGVEEGKKLQSSTLVQAHSQPDPLKSNIWTTRLIFPWKSLKIHLKGSDLMTWGLLILTLLC